MDVRPLVVWCVNSGVYDKLITRPEEFYRERALCMNLIVFSRDLNARHSCLDLMIYLLTAIGLTPGGSSTVHIYTQTIHRTTQNNKYIEQHKNFGRKRAVLPSCRVFTLAFALKLRKKQGKTSVRVAEQ